MVSALSQLGKIGSNPFSCNSLLECCNIACYGETTTEKTCALLKLIFKGNMNKI